MDIIHNLSFKWLQFKYGGKRFYHYNEDDFFI